MKIDMTDWKEFEVQELFNVVYGVNLELVNCIETNKDDPEAVAFVSRTESNNGVSAYVKPVPGVEPQPKDTITVAGGGSVLATFLQTQPFYSGRDLYLLYPKESIPHKAKLFIVTVIKANKYRYNYGRQANVTLPRLKLRLPAMPNGKPDWQWMESYIDSLHSEPLTTQNDTNVVSFDTTAWKWFVIEDLFDKFETGKGHDTLLDDGEECFYLGAKKSDNGIMRKCAVNESMLQDGNCIVFICNGAGSVGYANYMDKPFIATTDLVFGYADWLNEKTGLFVATVLCKERFKYSFGRKWKTHLRDTKIKLPATPDGKPDWLWMESYIESLPYGDRL